MEEGDNLKTEESAQHVMTSRYTFVSSTAGLDAHRARAYERQRGRQQRAAAALASCKDDKCIQSKAFITKCLRLLKSIVTQVTSPLKSRIAPLRIELGQNYSFVVWSFLCRRVRCRRARLYTLQYKRLKLRRHIGGKCTQRGWQGTQTRPAHLD